MEFLNSLNNCFKRAWNRIVPRRESTGEAESIEMESLNSFQQDRIEQQNLFQEYMEMLKNRKVADFNGKLDADDWQFSLVDFAKYRDCDSGGNFLHLICGLDAVGENPAYTTATSVLDRFIEFDFDLKFDFLNATEIKGSRRTPVQIAIEKRNALLVDYLLLKGAGIDFTDIDTADADFENFLRPSFVKHFLKRLDSSMHYETNSTDPDNRLLWKVTLDFGPICGYKSSPTDHIFYLRIGKNITNILNESRRTQSDILLHPLLYTFLHYKWHYLKNWVWISIIFHITWSIMGACLMYTLYNDECQYKFRTNYSSPVYSWLHDASTSSKIEKTLNRGQISSIFYGTTFDFITITISVIAALKELLELLYCPSKIYYIRQRENVGQIILIVSTIIGYSDVFSNNSCISKEIYLVGFSSAMLLLQGQLSNIEVFSFYNDMFSQGIWNVWKFLIAFSPTLVAFMFIFSVIMPKRNNSSALYIPNKVMAMTVGDLNYDDWFNPKEFDDSRDLNLLHYIFFIFVVIVVLLLQNLLIALLVSELKKLRENARVNILARHLEYVSTVEGAVRPQLLGIITGPVNIFKFCISFLFLSRIINLISRYMKPITKHMYKTTPKTSYIKRRTKILLHELPMEVSNEIIDLIDLNKQQKFCM